MKTPLCHLMEGNQRQEGELGLSCFYEKLRREGSLLETEALNKAFGMRSFLMVWEWGGWNTSKDAICRRQTAVWNHLPSLTTCPMSFSRSKIAT